MTNIPDSLHTRIKSARLNLGLSQAAMAVQTGVSQPTVANWENGSHVPRKGALDKIAEVLGVEAIWLLSGDYGEAASAAQTYVAEPTQHIPVYAWPDVRAARRLPPIRYVPFASHYGGLFAYQSPAQARGLTQFFICSPVRETDADDAEYLFRLDQDPVIARGADRYEDAQNLGRIVARIELYL